MSKLKDVVEVDNDEVVIPEELEAVLVEEEGGCRFEERCKVGEGYVCGYVSVGTVSGCPKRLRWLEVTPP